MSPYLEHPLPGLATLTRPSRGRTAEGLPIRPRRAHDAAHAAAILATARRDPRVLPRWGINSPIRDGLIDPGPLAGRHAWHNRDHWVSFTIPLVYAAHHATMRRYNIRLATLVRWAEAKSCYAHGGDPGRVIVRPSTIAGLMDCDERTVQRCNAAARAVGLEQLLVLGRMLSFEESTAARRAGSPQRGLASVVALCTPADIVRGAVDNHNARHVHVTPTSGTRSSPTSAVATALTTATATVKTSSLRSDLHQRTTGPPLHGSPELRTPDPQRGPSPSQRLQHVASRPESPSTARQPAAERPRRRLRNDCGYPLALELVQQIPWLRSCPAGRIAAQLNRYARADLPTGYHWTATRLIRAMDAVNVRLNYNSPTRPKIAPWGLLAWYLRQIDPIADADAPTAGALFHRPAH